jgi:hypothetical protein
MQLSLMRCRKKCLATGGTLVAAADNFVFLRAEAAAVDLVNPHLVADNSLGGIQ